MRHRRFLYVAKRPLNYLLHATRIRAIPIVNDEPWKRAYVVFKKGADTEFVPDQK